MKKEIRYPTAEWLDSWMNKHKGKSKEDAEMAWWDKEIDADRPTPFDLDEEHEQAAKKIVRKPANYSLEGKPKRERKPNEEKRMLIAFVGKALEGAEVENVTVANVEREVTFRVGENEYSLTLICHRKPKQK